jgi:hypothetical protein
VCKIVFKPAHRTAQLGPLEFKGEHTVTEILPVTVQSGSAAFSVAWQGSGLVAESMVRSQHDIVRLQHCDIIYNVNR